MQLLGFPVQLLGLFTIPLLVVRWGMDGVKPGDDVEKYTVSAGWGGWCGWLVWQDATRSAQAAASGDALLSSSALVLAPDCTPCP